MTYKLITLSGKNISINNPVSAQIKMSDDAVAHSLSISFVLDNDTYTAEDFVNDEFTKVLIYDDNQDFVTEMLADEQHMSCSSAGIIFNLYARSRASLLIDNEAVPQSYTRPSLNLIFDRHIKRFGFTKKDNCNPVIYDVFSVSKGQSNWRVLEDFCKCVSYNTPKITLNNELVFNKAPKDSGIVFTNKITNSSNIPYESLTYAYKRSDNISKILVKSNKGSGYDKVFKNSVAIKKGITKEKCINAVNELNSSYKIQNIINKANADCCEISVLACKSVFPELGDYVTLDDTLIGKLTKLRMKSIHYKLNANGEKCLIKLYKN